MAKECFYVGAEGDEPDKVIKGVAWLLENSRPAGGWIAVLGLDNLETISNYDARFAILKGLTKRKDHKTVINGRVIYLITERKIPYDGKNRPSSSD